MNIPQPVLTPSETVNPLSFFEIGSDVCWLIGNAHFGQLTALSEISLLHSGQFINAIFSVFITANGLVLRFVRLENRRFFGCSKSIVECLSVCI